MQIAKLNIEAGLAIEEEFGGETFDGMSEQAVYNVDADADVQDDEILQGEESRTKTRDFQIEQTRQIALLQDLRGADPVKADDAFSVVYTHYFDKSVSLTEKLLDTNGLAGLVSAEDLAQDVWLKIWKGRERVSAKGRFWMYLKRSLVNAVLNVKRNAAKRRTDVMDMTDVDEVHSKAVDPTSPMDSPEKSALKSELMAAMDNALSKLKPREEKALRMQAAGVKVKDIAVDLDIKPNRAKSLLRNARLKAEADLYERYPDLFGKPDNAE